MRVEPQTPKTTNSKTSFSRFREGRNPIRRSNSAPTIACNVLPKAAPQATTHDTPKDWANKKAPNVTPGQTRCPCKSSAAKAIPADGQTGEASILSLKGKNTRWAGQRT